MNKQDRAFQGMLAGQVLTPLRAAALYDMYCLSQRCTEWIRAGCPIKRERVSRSGSTYMSYRITNKAKARAWLKRRQK